MKYSLLTFAIVAPLTFSVLTMADESAKQQKALKILLIVVAAYLINRYGRRVVSRFAESLAQPATEEDEDANAMQRSIHRLKMMRERKARAAQRAETLGIVLRSLLTTVVWVVAGAMILGELGINLAPLIASAGIAAGPAVEDVVVEVDAARPATGVALAVTTGAVGAL